MTIIYEIDMATWALLRIADYNRHKTAFRKISPVKDLIKNAVSVPAKEALMYRTIPKCTAPIISICTVLAVVLIGCCISGCRSSQSNDPAAFTASNPNISNPDTSNPDTITPDTSTAGTSSSPATHAVANSPTLAWDVPTTYTDGSALLNLKEYRVYFSTSPNPFSTGSYYRVPAPATSVPVKNAVSQGTGTYYFVVTAVAAVGSIDRESDPSNEVSKYIQ